MRHNYFNLNQNASKNDGQPTVNRQSRLMSYRGYLKNLAMIFAVLVMSVANIGMAWGASPYSVNFTTEFTSTGTKSVNDGTVTIDAKVSSKTYNNTSSTYVAFLDGTFLTVSATSACITSISLNANTDNNSNNHQIAYATSADGSTWSSNTNIGTCANRKSTPSAYTVNFAEAVRYVRFTKVNNSISVGYISVTYSSCDAADLTASNITSNGNQEAGTGITFSKVGSPASGDTWYWQTSATGTDKTYNATSPYTTATTAGSYTVYLRAYNTAGNCWGTAASMTNTIYPAPSAMIHNTFAVNDAWSSTIATQDKTNITSLSALAAVGESVGSGSNKSGLTQKIPSQSSEDASKYMSLSFNVASGKQLNVTSVVFDEQPVSNTGTFKVSISDNQGSATKTQTIASGAAGSKHTLTLDGDIVGSFKGTVTVKVWAYGWGDGYRFGDYFYINGTVTAAAPSCTAPTSVVVTPVDEFGWRYSIGETISLTATATGGSGNYTYQWQKYIEDTWTNIDGATAATYTKTNCTTSDGGSYRCVVSTGTNCSLESEGYFVRVFTLNGGYTTDGEWTAHKIVWTSENTGLVTLSLLVSETYYFKVTDNDGKWFGYGNASNYIIQPWQADCGTGNSNIRLFTGPAGDYKFTINIEHAQENSPYVNIKVDYPEVTHPVEGYAYINKWWDCYVHYWEGASNALTEWGSDPKINSDRYVNICGTNYWYFPVIETYTNFIAKDNAGNPANTTGDQSTTNHSGQNITHNGSAWVWQEFSTYSITFEGNGNTGGSMTNVTGITCGGSATLTQNAFTRTGYTFAGWATTADGDVAHTDKATISNITSNITLYAKWNVNSYTLTASATVSNPMTADSKTGAITGSFTNNPVTDITSGTTTSTSSNTFTVNKGTPVTVTAAATIAGTAAQCDECTYVFDSWENIPASVTADVSTIHAIYKTTYSISFKETDETDVAGISASSYDYGVGKAASTLPTPTKSGYTFGGWYNENTLENPAEDIDNEAWGNIIYYAKWTAVPTPAGDCGEIIKSTFSGTKNSAVSTTTFTTTGEIGGTSTSAKIGDNGKLNTDGAYLILKLSTGTFLAGDTIKISSNKSNGVKFATGTVSTQTYTLIGTASTATSGGQPYYFVLAANADSIIVPRTSSDYNQNPEIAYVSVHRPCPECDAAPAAPTAFSAGSITSTGATFSIADAADAASYDIYYSTSSSAPDAGTAATTTSTSKTKAVTGLTANTTYYAWVRSVCDADHKSDWVALSGSTFTTSAGGGCTPQSVVKTVLSSTTAGITTGYNNDEYAGSATIVTFQTEPIDGGYKMQSGSKLFVTLKKGNFVEGDKINIVITKASDLPNTTGKLPIFYNASSPALLTTIDAASADTYTYTLTASDITTLGSNKTIGVFRSSSTTENNPYVKSVEVEGCRDWTVDETAPTFVSSVPANGATGVATSGTIVLTFNEPLGSVDPSKFTLTGATTGTVTIDGSDATKVNITYSGAANEATVTLATAAEAVSDLAGNALAAELSDISFTTAAAAPAGDCEELFAGRATSTSVFTRSAGSATFNLSSGNSFSAGGYSYSVKPNKSDAIVASPQAGGSFAAGDSLIVVVYNNESGSKTMGFRLGSGTYSTSVGSKKLHIFRQVLDASDISAGKVTFNRQSSDDRWVEIIIKHCGLLPSCTTPVLSDLEDQKVCPGSDVTWTANNTEALQDGETIAYQWNKKGNNTVLSSNATLTLNDVTEAAGGTYVVTVTVSKAGYASSTATKEVTLTVTPATATPTITANANTIYTGNDVTLTATCASSGVGYQWYTCTDAEGNGESEIGDAENATLALTAGEAGTYYYKVIVTGDGTHSCGTAERVYTLTVTAASECEKYFWFVYAADATSNGVINNRDNFFGSSPKTGSSNSSTYKFTLDGTEYTATRNTGDNTFSISFTVPEGSTATLAMNCKGSSSKPIYLIPTSGDPVLITDNSSNAAHVVENIAAGTYKVGAKTDASASWTLAGMAVQVCTASICTDATPTITAANTTVCVGSELSIAATGYESDPTSIQWQKLDGTWTNINGATAPTYTVASATAADAGSYRVVVTKGCARTSNTVTISVPSAPNFGSTVPASVSVMATMALSITDVEASDATSYAWYKSADDTYDAGTDTKVGTSKELLLAAGGEAAGATYYLFCVASNSCGSTTSGAITVNVTALVEEECATKGNETNDREFGFENTKCSEATLDAKKVWSTNSRDKYLTYTAPEGKYFATAKVTVAHTGGTKCGYAYSTNRGATWVVAELDGLSATLTAITIDLPENVNAFRISRNLTAQDGEKGSDSGTFYLAEACFTYENACTPTSVTPTTTSREYNISENADFEEPTFTVKHGEDIVNDAVLTYTSSNPAIATVDEEGSVTFEGMTGTVTITAAYAGTTIDEIEYCASEGSYTITVSCEDEEPKIIAAAGTNLDGCNNSITLEAKRKQDGNSFTGGTFQWYRDGEAIEGANSASYEVVRAGTYTVSRTDACITMSSKPAVVTNENPEPKVERLTPFQYYHVDKDYSDQMKDRHLFAVTSYGTLDGKRYHLTATRNGEALNLSSSTAFFTIPSSDNAVDTVMIDLNELKGKYSANDEIVITCAPIDNCNEVSAITSSITIHVIDQTPTLALICSGADGEGTRNTKKLVVGGDFLTGYNKADLCLQTGNTTFDANTEWGLYTELNTQYIVTPVNGYAVFNKLNYEPFDILLLTDYPKSSKSEAAQKIIDDMAELCDYRPLLSFKTHFQSDKWTDKTTGEYKYTKWVKKGFTTAPVVPKQTATYVNVVCYAHPMFEDIDDIKDEYTFHDDDDPNQLVYQVLTRPGYEGDKGIQGFELADADNFVTIGLVHYNAVAEEVLHNDDHTHISWNAEANDRLLVAMAERQTNIEARMMLFSLNCGAQSLQTEGGRRVILKCLEYLLETDPLEVADCRMTFDNGAGNTNWGKSAYEGTGTKGDGLWSTAANWGPDYLVVPGRNNDVRIAAPCIVDGVKTKVSVGNEVQETIQYYPEVLSIHITENGSLTIPANSSLTARSTILRADENGNVYPTNVADISLGSNAGGNASLILNNERGDTKAGVAMYSTAKADTDTYSAAASTWQYIGTPHSDVANAIYNYYDSWLYQYDTGTEGWVVIPNGGPLVPFRGYCVTHPESPHTYWMEGTLVSTTNQDITIPAERFVVVANSWTAPIQIKELTNDDMEGLTDKTIYFFNTGSDPNKEGELNKVDGRYAAGTYVSVPIYSASYTGDSIIPSMQGFYVVGGDADGTLHLDYERHVRAKRENVPSGPMHAPARIADTDNEPQVAKFLFRGTRYDDRLIILERPDFTRGYDSGWDGEQWGGNAAAPMSYVVTETRWDAVSAIPEYEGTVIAFRAGEDSEYTIHFDYDGMEDALYLLDTDTKIYTRVLKGNSYTFTCTDKAEHNRFILTRKAPQIATGTENIATGENAKAVKFIKDDKIFIFVNGMLYDATGKVVK